MPAPIQMKTLLEAGVHFGHQTRRWDPRMRPFIFTERNGIHIIDLQQTVRRLDEAMTFVRQQAADGKTMLFVGTKKQAQDTIAEEATRAGMPYVNQRWLGGTLTNFSTILTRIRRMEDLDRRREAGEMDQLPKKEAKRLMDELEKLQRMLGGWRKTYRVPDMVFIVDPHREAIAVQEANRLRLPIVAMADTNCNPQLIDWPVPSNDDAIRAVRLIAGKVADAMIEGREARAAVLPEEGLTDEEIEEMPLDVPMMTEADFEAFTPEEEDERSIGGGALAIRRRAPPEFPRGSYTLAVNTEQIRSLREATGAGIMDCKKALEESGGDRARAEWLLKEWGLASVGKKVGREAKQGVVESYIHAGGRVGALVEVNCETDFVARTPDFRALAHDLAMQVAAMNPTRLTADSPSPAGAEGDVPLLEQSFIKDSGRTIQDLVNEAIAKLGENVVVRRFARFELGAD